MFTQWFKDQSIEMQIVKIKKIGSGKFPLLKISIDNAKKINGKEFDGKKIEM